MSEPSSEPPVRGDTFVLPSGDAVEVCHVGPWSVDLWVRESWGELSRVGLYLSPLFSIAPRVRIQPRSKHGCRMIVSREDRAFLRARFDPWFEAVTRDWRARHHPGAVIGRRVVNGSFSTGEIASFLPDPGGPWVGVRWDWDAQKRVLKTDLYDLQDESEREGMIAAYRARRARERGEPDP